MTSAGSVQAARPATRRAGGGATPTPALRDARTLRPRDILVRPVPHSVARAICERHHYLHSYPGGGVLDFGVFAGSALLGVLVLGVGPSNIHRLFRDARRGEVLCLARLWLDDRLGRNSESRVLGIVLRALRRSQSRIKALVAYGDPGAGHSGVIYRAAGFAYVGLSQGTPLYRLEGSIPHHSRSFSAVFGTRSQSHFAANGLRLERVPQTPKVTYIAFVDPAWRNRLLVPVQPYPHEEARSCL